MSEMNTPWKAGCGDGMWSADHATSHAYGDAPIVDGNNVVVAIAVTSASNDKDAERRDFILEAVNSHASLVEENKRLREALAGLIEKYEEIVLDDDAGRSLKDIDLVRAKEALNA